MMKAAAIEIVAPDNVASVRSLCTYNGKSVRWVLTMNTPSIGRVGRSFQFSNLPEAKLLCGQLLRTLGFCDRNLHL
jgi:hypothetical protein